MAKYTSGRQKNLKVGLTSYSENKTSLEVIGKVGIGTTKAASSLHVVGDQNVTGISTLGTVKISSGIVTSSNPGLTTVTFVGNLTGTATTAGFAFTAFKLEGFDFDTTVVGFASTATNVIGGIASVTQLSVSGVSTFGNSTSGIKIDGTTGIITSNTGIAITFIGNLTGTASTASFATTSINVIGGIASVTQLSVSGVSTVGILTASKIGIGTTNPTSEFVVIGNSSISGIVTIGAGNTGVTIDGVNGIVTSSRPGVTTVTYFGNLKGNSDTTSKLKTAVNIGGVSFDGSGNINLPGVNAEGNQSTSGTAASAGNLNFGSPNQIYFRNSANATTSNNFTFDGNNLKVSGLTTASSLNISGVSTFGVSGGTDGVVIKTENGAGIVTSSNPGLTTVTYYGTLIGTAQVNVENVTNTSNVIGGIASVTDLRVSGLSTVGVLTATKIGIGTTNPTSELVVIGDIFSTGITTLGTVKISSGIVTSTTGTAVTFVGNLTGTATTSGFARTAFGLETQSALSIRVGFATTARDVIGGIASVTDLKVTGISTFGNSTTGIKIDGTTGIITSNTGVAVTFFGNLTGTASTASFATTAFSLQGFVPSTGSVGFATTATNVIGGIASVTDLKVTGISTFGNSTTGIKIDGTTGIITSNTGVAVTFVGNLSGTASTASFATTAFSLQGFVPSTGSVGFATTATNLGVGSTGSLPYQSSAGITTFLSAPEVNNQVLLYSDGNNKPVWGKVGLGTNTTGQYVKSITGTANQITVTNGTGEGSTPTISIPNDPTLPGNVTIGNNLSVNGNLTIGGTSTYIAVNELRVKDKDIVLGIATNIGGIDVSTDFTANHGGIAIASTEGSPLIDINGGVGTDNIPTTYKQIMWLKSGSWTGLGTDAWLFNYGVGIGSTQFPSGTRLAVGNVQFTQNDLQVVRNINSSGISTFGNASTGIKIDGTTGIITSNTGVAITFFGNLTGTASTASFATTAFSLQGFTPTTGSVGFATTATNLANGAQGSLPYQNSSGITSFLSATATPDQVLVYDLDTNKPKWAPVTGTGAISGITINDDPNTNASRFLLFTGATSGTVGSQNVSSSRLVFNPARGSLGIGTTNPTSKLTVQGDLLVSGFSTFIGGLDVLNSLSITSSQPGDNLFEIYDNSQKVVVAVTTSGNLGIGSSNPSTPLQVGRYGVKSGFGTFTASAGVSTDIDSFTISSTDFKTAEYTVHIQSPSSIQAQKVLVMQNGTSAFSEEYAIMYDPNFVVSVGATVSGGLCKLQFTPETGVSGLVTYRFTRETMF
jgi:hypothetical protein